MAKIYGLKCSVNGFVYVGVTAGKLAKRMREHRCLLRQRKHSEKKMVDDWHAYGEAAFELIILQDLGDSATTDAKREAELKWMYHFRDSGILYNTILRSYQPPPEVHDKAIAAAMIRHGILNWERGEDTKKRADARRHTRNYRLRKKLREMHDIVCSSTKVEEAQDKEPAR